MTEPFSHSNMKQETATSQNMILSQAMQQAFHVLQMPVVELAEWMKTEIEQNPVLEYQEEVGGERAAAPLDEDQEIDFEKTRFEVLDGMDESFERAVFPDEKEGRGHLDPASSLPSKPTLFDHLMQQAMTCFISKEELAIAETLIGNLDEQGFFSTCLEQLFEEKDLERALIVLLQIQTFDPAGIAAKNLQDSLLLQLKLRGKEKSLAYAIIRDHYEELLHNRLAVIQKAHRCTLKKLQKVIKEEIASLDTHPASRFRFDYVQSITADLSIRKEESQWKIEISEEGLPHFRIAPIYFHSLSDNSLEKQEKKFIRTHIASGKWLARIIERRKETLRKIGALLIKRQSDFLSGNKKWLEPMTLQEAAREIGVHESTMARAVAGKYVDCVQGLLPLRSFFTHAFATASGGAISNQTVKQLLLDLIQKEDKSHPLSDQLLAEQITAKGIPCARRTIAKYRNQLKIPSASHRKQWH